jgi:hypothetical protein
MHGMWWAALLNSFAAVLDSGGAGGGGGSFESIATATGTGSSATITFSSIPSTYQHLQIRFIAKNSINQNWANASRLFIRFNSDTGTNYAWHKLAGDGSTAAATGDSSNTSIRTDFCVAGNGSGITNIHGVGVIDIHDYAVTTKNKTIRTFTGSDANNLSYYPAIGLTSGLWMNTNAITSISLIDEASSNFLSSSVFSLYGIKGA